MALSNTNSWPSGGNGSPRGLKVATAVPDPDNVNSDSANDPPSGCGGRKTLPIMENAVLKTTGPDELSGRLNPAAVNSNSPPPPTNRSNSPLDRPKRTAPSCRNTTPGTPAG